MVGFSRKLVTRVVAQSSTPKSIRVLALVRRDRQRRLRLDVSLQQISVVDVGEDVAVHHEEVLGATHRAPISAGPMVPSGDVSWRYETSMPHCEPSPTNARMSLPRWPIAKRDLLEALLGELQQHDLEDRVLVADRHEWLGDQRGVRPQPNALAAGNDHRLTSGLGRVDSASRPDARG